MRCHVALLACTAALLHGASPAAEIYRWVDENGRTQLSDVVPDKYRGVATRTDSAQYELSPAQRDAAQARAAADKARATEAAAQRARSQAAEAASAAATAGLTGKAPRAAAPAKPSCEALQRKYIESQECFAPYRMANGALNAAAFEKCTPVLNPASECGSAPSN